MPSLLRAHDKFHLPETPQAQSSRFGVECFNGRSNIVPVKCSVCFSEGLRLSRKRRIHGVHFFLTASLVTGTGPEPKGRSNNQQPASKRLSCRDCITHPSFSISPDVRTLCL